VTFSCAGSASQPRDATMPAATATVTKIRDMFHRLSSGANQDNKPRITRRSRPCNIFPLRCSFQRRPTGIQPFVGKNLTDVDAIGTIELEQELGDAADGGSPHDSSIFKAKLTVPTVFARMKQPNDVIGHRIDGGHIAAFVTIANGTGPCQIFGDGFAAMFTGNDVIRLMRFPGVVLMKQTIFTTAVRSLLQQVAHGVRNVVTHDATVR
jgi:hypothetical protein